MMEKESAEWIWIVGATVVIFGPAIIMNWIERRTGEKS